MQCLMPSCAPLECHATACLLPVPLWNVMQLPRPQVVPGRIHEFTLECLADIVENLNKLE